MSKKNKKNMKVNEETKKVDEVKALDGEAQETEEVEAKGGIVNGVKNFGKKVWNGGKKAVKEHPVAAGVFGAVVGVGLAVGGVAIGKSVAGGKHKDSDNDEVVQVTEAAVLPVPAIEQSFEQVNGYIPEVATPEVDCADSEEVRNLNDWTVDELTPAREVQTNEF